jgi:periplasmic protein TonB
MVSCPPTPAAIVQRADAEIPEIARQQQAEGTAIIKIDIDANGHVTKAVVQKSAGHPALDQAALKAGRATSFKAATESCKPVASVYLMVVDLHP